MYRLGLTESTLLFVYYLKVFHNIDYSVLLASYIVENHNIPVVCSGGELPDYFGVITKRGTVPKINQEFWIPVPENMRPVNYNKIEGGCYW